MPSRKHLTSTAAGQLAIGIDMGGTSVKLGVCRGAELLFQACPIPTRNFRGAMGLLAAMREAIHALQQEVPGIAAVGVGVPGFTAVNTGMVHALTHVPGWENVPLKKKLSAQLHKTFRNRLRIVRARFGNEAGIIGSAAVAVERL